MNLLRAYYVPTTNRHHTTGEAPLMHFGLECQDKEVNVRRLINDNDAITEHLPCAKHCAPHTLSNLMFATILWDIIELGLRMKRIAHSHTAQKQGKLTSKVTLSVTGIHWHGFITKAGYQRHSSVLLMLASRMWIFSEYFPYQVSQTCRLNYHPPGP